MPDDPTLQWKQVSRFGILIDEDADAWYSGHLTDIIDFPDRAMRVIATDTGGVWMVNDDLEALSLSENWDIPDVRALARGPDGPDHLFAGCGLRFFPDLAPIIMETDPGGTFPLLEWYPVSNALPANAGKIMRIAVIRNLRRIVAACAKWTDSDTGGVFWATIPSFSPPSGPPRPPFTWRRAKVAGFDDSEGFWDITVAATQDDERRSNLEDRRSITLVAGGYKKGGVAIGKWGDDGELAFARAAVAYRDGADATGMLFDHCGSTSVCSCEGKPTVLYAACSGQDGRLNSLLRSEDGGRNWVFPWSGADVAFGGVQALVGEQGNNWNNCFACHPADPRIAALGWQNGTFLTLDSGDNWKVIDGGNHLHADVHALLFVTKQTGAIGDLYIGSDGGLARVDLDAYLGGTGQPVRSNYNRNLPTLQSYSTLIRQLYGTIGSSAVQPGLMVAGLQDNGNVACDLLPSVTPWRQVDGGDGGWVAFLNDGSLSHHTNTTNISITAPGKGGKVTPLPAPLPPPSNPASIRGEAVFRPLYRALDGYLLVAVAGSQNVVFGLFVDTSLNYYWKVLGSLPAGEQVAGFTSYEGYQVRIGTQGTGRIFVIDMPTGTMTEDTVTLPKPSPTTVMAGGTVSRIVAFGRTDVFATLLSAKETNISGFPIISPAMQTYVLRLVGTDWQPTPSFGLPNGYLYGFERVIAPQTRLPRGLLATADDAVYVSRDDGANWNRASSGLPRRAHCGDIRFVADWQGGATIYLGTFGRSVWSAKLR